MAVESLPEQFLAWLRLDRNRSANTISTYRRTLRALALAADPSVATRDQVEAWWRSRTHLAPASRANELAALRSFYAWATRFEHRSDDPTRRLDPPQLPKGLPRPASRADVLALLGSLPADLRRAVCLGAYAGLRISEVAALEWADVDLEHSRIRVVGKGQKTRLAPLSAVLLDSLLPNTGGNVVTAGGMTYSAGTLQRRVNRAIDSQHLNITFHQLRHRFGTIAVGSGVPLLSVSRAMGHSSPATTAIYAATSDADLDLIGEAVTR